MSAEHACREPGQVVDAGYVRQGIVRYVAEGREIVGRNGTYFNNRPLYCEPQTEAVVLAGDRPLVRLIATPYIHGAFALGILRGADGKWLHDYEEVESRYRCGRMTWRVADPALQDVQATLDVVPLKQVGGCALRFRATGLRAGDRLVWTFGGARPEDDLRTSWDPVMRGNPDVCKTGDPRKPQLKWGMVPEWCQDNQIQVDGHTFRLLPTASVADRWPMVCGVLDLRAGADEIFWAIEVASPRAAAESVSVANPAKTFADGVAYLHTVERVRTETPDSRLDAAVAAVCHPIDASCERNPFIFRHGCMAFSIRFLGWRVICGATALGWHERVKGNAAYYTALQVKTDAERTHPQSDAERCGCHEGSQSRFWGRGRLSPSPGQTHMYNSQSQFFDQTIRDWRWTADTELEAILRPALELHLEWAKDCFDPDDDGLYESYINTLPTDSVWYNGGGSVEESAYACYGHVAAMDMARRAGDVEAAARHKARAAKIRQASMDVLWQKDRGHFGLYVEQGGHRRVHSDAWVYSEFLPIDAGIATAEEALQALYFTEWGLERIRLPFGGVLCQPSNWAPSKWSVRDMFGGDLCHLALAYFQTGLGDEGWELLLGATLESAYASAAPGGFSHIGAGTDFADNAHMYARVVVEGLFGFNPDYPNAVVHLQPAFPSAWPRASIRTPDYSLDYRQEGDTDAYRLTLTREADVDFRLPVRAEKVRRITLDGQEIQWDAVSGFGCTWVRFQTPRVTTAEVKIEIARRLPQAAAVMVEGKVGDEVCLKVPRGRIMGWQDLHQVLVGPQTDGTAIRGRLTRKPGYHLLLAEVTTGELSHRQVFKVHVTDPRGEAEWAARIPRAAPAEASWECLDLAEHYNGDIRTIFQHPYLSPRPKTCSVRLGVDGYSAWTFPYWGNKPPTIDLSNVPNLAKGQGRIMTPQRVPFTRFPDEKNVAFTSLWDNWPRAVSVPVNRTAKAVWLLVCGSTFPMQSRIANAEVRFRYADGHVETLDLTPPLNFWSLCPWGGADYSYEVDGFCLPRQPPPAVQLGNNCRAMVLSWNLRREVELTDVTLETLSQDVVIGLMGVSLMFKEL
ncbi:MAG: hypothetical protein CVU38_01915 [Chloroflexi bacterium HGW-Chloroflexi-1]|nr:MAG: hypothetical protein CVU38_01915 [Chloroflexi bacterium HGW-Chloroflexi-1]